MSKAVSGIGASFRRWVSTQDSDGAWVKIAGVLSIGGPTMSRDTIETTSLDNTDGYKSFIGALRDGGDVSFSMIFARAEYETMKDDFEDDAPQNYEIVLPDADNTTLEFEGLVTELPLDVPIDDKITCDIGIKISGKVELDSGSGS